MKYAWKNLIRKAKLSSMTNVVPSDMAYDNPLFQKLYTQVQEFSMTSMERLYALYKGIEYIVKNDIPGDLVECGVWKGGSSMLSALTLKHLGDTNRIIYLYDTYAGMTEPTVEDVRCTTHKIDALPKWKTLERENHNDWCYAPLEEVRDNLLTTAYPEKNLVFVKGRVEDTIPQTIPKKIAMLRLDTDWYLSTKHELEHLFPILSQNGILIIDDYGHWAGAKKAVDEYFSDRPIYLARVDQTGRVGIKTTSYEA